MTLWLVQAVLGILAVLTGGFLMALFLENRMGAVFRPEWIELFALWYPLLAAVMTVVGCMLTARRKT